MPAVDRIELRDKIEKLQRRSYNEALGLIYEWVKTGSVNKGQFTLLLTLLEEIKNTQEER